MFNTVERMLRIVAVAGESGDVDDGDDCDDGDESIDAIPLSQVSCRKMPLMAIIVLMMVLGVVIRMRIIISRIRIRIVTVMTIIRITLPIISLKRESGSVTMATTGTGGKFLPRALEREAKTSLYDHR